MPQPQMPSFLPSCSSFHCWVPCQMAQNSPLASWARCQDQGNQPVSLLVLTSLQAESGLMQEAWTCLFYAIAISAPSAAPAAIPLQPCYGCLTSSKTCSSKAHGLLLSCCNSRLESQQHQETDFKEFLIVLNLCAILWSKERLSGQRTLLTLISITNCI